MDRTDRATVSLISVVLALGALALGLAAVFIAGDSTAGGSLTAAGVAPAQQLELTLADLKIAPAMPEVPAGPVVVHVTNSGSQVHNLSFPALGKDSGDIQPGQAVTMDLGVVAAGTYDMVCTIAGHAAAGMTGMLHVGSATTGGAAASDSAAGPTTTMDANAMDAAMEKVAKEFPATTAGHGGDLLEPTVLADGTKQFDLTAKVVDWEVAPGKTVEGLDLQRRGAGTDDQGRRRRQGADRAEQRAAGVDRHPLPRHPGAQRDGRRRPLHPGPVKPGESSPTSSPRTSPAVGMYHSHHDAQVQVPNGMFGAFLIGEMPMPSCRWPTPRSTRRSTWC